ncbi:MAG: DHH family phosphoesterase, partial [Terrimicrobiaceae bacterium]|nr:DHH family phosphoesterase [Terrimicrobiaceae bacterium]
VLIVGDRRNIQRIAIEAGIRAIIVTGGAGLDAETARRARERGTCVLLSAHDTATSVLLARSAVRAGDLINENFEFMLPETTLQEARQRAALSPQFAFPVVGEDGILRGILTKSDFLKPPPRQLILVDHNELSQAVPGASEAPILEILDHHRIGAPPTTQPILFLNRPVGSTCSIVADCYEREGLPIPPPIAGLLMCGLIADTLNLTSPTTTDFDRALMPRLAAIAGVRPADLAGEIFSIGSPLLTLPPAKAIEADCKEYNEGGRRFSVSQIEELSFTHFPEKHESLAEALEAGRAARGLDFAALLVTDVNTQNSILLLRGPESLIRLVDYPEAGPHAWRLDGVVSRKKQLLPYLLGLVSRWGGDARESS